MGQHLDSEDPRAALDAAKVVVGKLAPQVAPEPQSDTAEEVSTEQAIKELVATLPIIGIAPRDGPVSRELVDDLRRALRQALSDLESELAPLSPPIPAAMALRT